eukprot:1722135-Rhodomonas_salina.1
MCCTGAQLRVEDQGAVRFAAGRVPEVPDHPTALQGTSARICYARPTPSPELTTPLPLPGTRLRHSAECGTDLAGFVTGQAAGGYAFRGT